MAVGQGRRWAVTAWRNIAQIAAPLRERALGLDLDDDLRVAAAQVLADTHGVDVLDDVARMALINVAVLAVKMRERLVAHELRRPVPEVVASTDLHSLPDEPPALLRGPCIVDVRRPGEETLIGPVGGVGATSSLACYELDGTLYVIGLQHPDGVAVTRWRPQWGGGEVDAGIVQDDSLLVDTDTEAHAAWGREAARFLVVLGCLLDAEHTPLATTDDPPRPATRRKGVYRPAQAWAVRRVYLEARARSGGRGGGEGEPVDGRLDVTVPVTGHLKRQPYGPGGKLRKWVYVAGYEARRWVAPKPLRVVVGR